MPFYRNALKSLAVTLLFLTSLPVCAQPQKYEATTSVALNAEVQERYEDAYRIWSDLLTLGEDNLGEGMYSFARSHIFYVACKRIAHSGRDCTFLSVKNVKALGPPGYNSPLDAYFPALLIAESSCAAQQGEKTKALAILEAAEYELHKVPAKNAISFVPEIEHYIDVVRRYANSKGSGIAGTPGIALAWDKNYRPQPGSASIAGGTNGPKDSTKNVGDQASWTERKEIDSDDCISIPFVGETCHTVTYTIKFQGQITYVDRGGQKYEVRLTDRSVVPQDWVSPMYWTYKSRAQDWADQQKYRSVEFRNVR